MVFFNQLQVDWPHSGLRHRLWQDGFGRMTEVCQDGATFRGKEAWTRAGVAVGVMSSLPVAIYTGERFASNVSMITPVADGCHRVCCLLHLAGVCFVGSSARSENHGHQRDLGKVASTRPLAEDRGGETWTAFLSRSRMIPRNGSSTAIPPVVPLTTDPSIHAACGSPCPPRRLQVARRTRRRRALPPRACGSRSNLGASRMTMA